METSSSATYKETHTVRQQTTTTVGVIDRRYFQDGFGIIKFALKVIEVVIVHIFKLLLHLDIKCLENQSHFHYKDHFKNNIRKLMVFSQSLFYRKEFICRCVLGHSQNENVNHKTQCLIELKCSENFINLLEDSHFFDS